ncbi:MAG TPA: prepilin peptidase [Terriglobales bacterium]|nr:prepilin peptidase [Terriglobales bacterium]
MTEAFEYLFPVFLFFLGLAFGSFLNVCIHRLPRGLSVVRPRSACPACSAAIGARDNIPVLSWILLGGRCRHCRARISPRYAVVELLTALLFLMCYFTFGLSLATLKYCVFGFLLLGLIFTDAETKLLPDKLTLPGMALGFLFSLFVPVGGLVGWLLPDLLPAGFDLELAWRLRSLADSLLGAAVGASFIYGAGALYLRARGVEGMGFGDVKLMGMIGAFLGVHLTILTLFAASLAGSLFGLATVVAVWVRRFRRIVARGREPAAAARRRAWRSAKLVYRHYEMPFGVFLGSMALVAVFLGHAFLRWYTGRYS